MEKNTSLPKRRLFVVIHTVSSYLHGLDHAMYQTTIAQAMGADGIFIIPDYAKGPTAKATTEDQLLYLKELQETFPDFLIGANFLLKQLSDIQEYLYAIPPDLLQTDSSSVEGLDRTKLSTTELFCGVAFKYSANVHLVGDQLRDHCIRVANLCDVPTTSGTATGVSADIAKIREIVSYMPAGKRIGIASGVTEDNVKTYLEAGVTDFLVATSLGSHVDELSRDILDPQKVLTLAEIIHSV